jgi:large subunit ribosomal protein L33
MAQKHLVKIKSEATGHIRYTRRNKKTVEKKLEVKKFDPIARAHAIYKETKK